MLSEAMTKELVTVGTCLAVGREVCARRARKLRRRGETVQYAGRTCTGKARYRWMRAVVPADSEQGAYDNLRLTCTTHHEMCRMDTLISHFGTTPPRLTESAQRAAHSAALNGVALSAGLARRLR